MLHPPHRRVTVVMHQMYEPEATALFARMSVQPDSTRKSLISAMIKALKTVGVWRKLDALYVFAAHDAQASRLNWLTDAYNCAPVASPVFAVDKGYAGDGISSYLNTSFGPSVAASPKFAQNNASFGAWSLTSGVQGNQQILGQTTNVIVPWLTGYTYLRVNNSGTSSSGANTYSDGFFLANRSVSNAETLRRNKTQIASSSAASVAVDSVTFTICKRTTSFSTLQIAVGFIGGSLTTTESDAFYDASYSYLKAIGTVS